MMGLEIPITWPTAPLLLIVDEAPEEPTFEYEKILEVTPTYVNQSMQNLFWFSKSEQNLTPPFMLLMIPLFGVKTAQCAGLTWISLADLLRSKLTKTVETEFPLYIHQTIFEVGRLPQDSYYTNLVDINPNLEILAFDK